MDDRKSELIALLNRLFSIEKIHYADFNCRFMESERSQEALDALESENTKLGITPNGITTLCIIATITDVLCDERLAFDIDGEGFIRGVVWWDEPAGE